MLKICIDFLFFFQSMDVNRTDYTFTSTTGSINTKFGKAIDCNGPQYVDTCPHFGKAIIDTRGTGLIIDPTVWTNIPLYICSVFLVEVLYFFFISIISRK